MFDKFNILIQNILMLFKNHSLYFYKFSLIFIMKKQFLSYFIQIFANYLKNHFKLILSFH